jgi:hypothetical protein
MVVQTFQRMTLLTALVLSSSYDVRAAECGFRPSFTRPDERGTQTVQVFKGDPVQQLNGARPLLFITSLKVNTDGTKISYHTKDVTGRRCASNPSAVDFH